MDYKIRDYLRIDYEALQRSYEEAYEIKEYYHNRQFTAKQLQEFKALGITPENYNIIKLYERILRGYFSSIISNIVAKAGNNSSPVLAKAMDDTLKSVLEANDFEILNDDLKLPLILYGFLAVYYSVSDSGKKNSFNEPINDIKIKKLITHSVIPDHMATERDFSDARRISHWKWISSEEFKELFGARKLAEFKKTISTVKTDLSSAYMNSEVFGEDFRGAFYDDEKYLVVNTVVKTSSGFTSYHWCGDYDIKKEKLDFNPYRCFKLYDDTVGNEFYGLFRELLPVQDAINEHIMNIKRFDNDERLFVDVNKLENGANKKAEFTRMYNAVGEVIFMDNLVNAFHSDKFSKEIAEELAKLEAALKRAMDLLGITPSFLGNANASDSGRKVKYQYNASTNSFNYIDVVFKNIFKTLGQDIVYLIKKYKTAHELIRLTNKFGQDNWTEINAPFVMPINTPDGLMYRMITREETDKEGRVLRDEKGAIRLRQVKEPEQDLAKTDVVIYVNAVNQLETDEMERVITETMLQGAPGQFVANASPGAYAHMLSISMNSLNSKHSTEFAQIFDTLAEQLGYAPTVDPRMIEAAGNNTERKNGGAQLANSLGMQNDLGGTQ